MQRTELLPLAWSVFGARAVLTCIDGRGYASSLACGTSRCILRGSRLLGSVLVAEMLVFRPEPHRSCPTDTRVAPGKTREKRR